VKVCLIRKHAECIDGVSLHGRKVGDLIELPEREAELLVAEEWAVSDRRKRRKVRSPIRRRADDPKVARS
jgi:hypothetical protein